MDVLEKRKGQTAGRWVGIRVSHPVAELVAIAGLTVLLMAMAALNGFPLLFYDFGAYMYQGFTLVPSPDRSAVYSLFLRYGDGQASLWHVAWLQCAITAFAVTEFARAVAPHTSLRRLLGIGLLLTVLTSAAWVAGQLQPDFLTPVLVLVLYPLAFHARHLGAVRCVLLMAVAALATAGHPSHLGISAGLVIVFVLVWLLGRRWLWLPRPNVILPLLGFAFGLGLVLQANHTLTHRYFISRSGPVFFAARLIADGAAVHTLNDVCPTHPLKLCPYRGNLPGNADTFLWSGNTAFDKTGRFAPSAEYEYLVRETVKRYPLRAAGGLVLQGVAQFFMVASGDGFQPVQMAMGPSFANHAPHQEKAYLAALQQQGFWNFYLINAVQLPLALLALWWLIVSLRRNLDRRRDRAVLAAYLLFALIGNAIICGMVSGAHNRYQSRLVWIVPFALLLTEPQVLRRYRPRKS